MSVREKVVQAKSLGKSYGAVTALDNISFEIGRGEIVGFAGDNGAGKSTLMKMVSGDVTPTTGELLITTKLRIICQRNTLKNSGFQWSTKILLFATISRSLRIYFWAGK